MTQTALYNRHVALGGRMVDFAGWELPIQYATGPKAEHHCVRNHAGLFDIDHMGQVRVSGPDAVPYLQHILTANIARLVPSQARYALMCYADGGIVDDVFVYCEASSYMLVINAANRDKDIRWLAYHADDYDVQVDNISDETYMLALQGPQAQAVLQNLASSDLDTIGFHKHAHVSLDGVDTLMSRTGYTGEDGFELYFDAAAASNLWDAILEAGVPYGVQPIGLAARDSLRLEAAMALYGHEIHAQTNAIEAGLNWAVSYKKGDFIGRDAILKAKFEGTVHTLVGLRMVERGVPREHYEIAHMGELIGHTASGGYAPTLDAFIATAFVQGEYAQAGTELDVIMRGQPRKALVVDLPFYEPRYKR